MSQPRCECGVFWPDDERHHPECPVGRRIAQLEEELSQAKSDRQQAWKANEKLLAQLAEARELLQELDPSSLHGDLYAFNGTSQWVARRDDLLEALAGGQG
jgi:hypothetical protein